MTKYEERDNGERKRTKPDHPHEDGITLRTRRNACARASPMAKTLAHLQDHVGQELPEFHHIRFGCLCGVAC